MRVLSLFDGASCGRVALARAGVRVTEYHAFEIEKPAIKVSQANWPDIIHHGSVVGADFKALGKFDLLIGGSPCQGFSTIGSRAGFTDSRSSLFYEFIRAGHEVRPDYFLLENVRMTPPEVAHINYYLGGVTPVEINSLTVSAQSRRRLYWSNLKRRTDIRPQTFVDIWQPYSKPATDAWHMWFATRGEDLVRRSLVKILQNRDDTAICLLAGHVANWNGNIVPLGDGRFRFISPEEAELLQTLPVGYTSSVSSAHRYRMLGNGWTVDVIKQFFHLSSFGG